MVNKSIIGAVLFVLFSVQVHAAPISVGFSFYGDPNDFPLLGHSYIPGTVTGVLYGLQKTGLNQQVASLDFTSDVSGMGITKTQNITFSFQSGGLDILDGVVTSSNWYANIIDPTKGGLQLKLGHFGLNMLRDNGAYISPFDIGMGNADGMQGIQFNEISAVPIPTAIWLFGSGLIGLIGFARRKA